MESRRPVRQRTGPSATWQQTAPCVLESVSSMSPERLMRNSGRGGGILKSRPAWEVERHASAADPSSADEPQPACCVEARATSSSPRPGESQNRKRALFILRSICDVQATRDFVGDECPARQLIFPVFTVVKDRSRIVTAPGRCGAMESARTHEIPASNPTFDSGEVPARLPDASCARPAARSGAVTATLIPGRRR